MSPGTIAVTGEEDLGAMESSTSVYMCFPCYQEFDTLDEVLKHQLTCNAEATEPAPSASGLSPVTLQQPQEAEAPAWETEHAAVPDATPPPATPPDQPRILYQCGDCNQLFKTLELWQEHRKNDPCNQSIAEPPPEPDPEQEPEAEHESDRVPSEATDESDDMTVEAPGAEEEPQVQQNQAVSGGQATAQDDSLSRKRGAKKPKPEPVFLCVDCGSSFGMVSELVAHRKSQHGLEEALHRCSVCGESFLNTTLFLYHRKQHRQKGEEKGEVPENTAVACTSTTSDASSTRGTGEQVLEAPVPVLSSSSSSASLVFTQPEVFMCTLCGGSFKNVELLSAHRTQKHGLKDPLHLCLECGTEFMNTTQFLYHRRQHSTPPEMPEADAAGEAVEFVDAEGNAIPHNGDYNEEEDDDGKRPCSPAASATDPEAPAPKKARPAIRILSKNASLKAKPGPGGMAVAIKVEPEEPASTNQPPPAKLLQDWARTPLPHVCPYCGKTFTRRVFLRTHVFSHTGEKLFTCKLCGLEDDGTSNVYPCPQCTARFSTDDQLKHHILLHSSHPFPCTVCGEAFSRRKELDLHALSHQDKEPVTCEHCSAQFVNQSVLDIHLQRCPTSEEDKNVGRGRGQGRGRCTGQIECDLCGHRCMTQEGLDLHRLSHTGQTPLKCPVMGCRRRFASNGALEEHVLAHIRGTLSKARHRPRFRCDICLKDKPVPVAQVLEGAEVLTSLAGVLEGEAGGVQTIYVLQQDDCGAETLMISSEQLVAAAAAAADSSQMVILPSSVLGGGQTIALAHSLAMEGGEIMVQTGSSPSQQHTIEFIVEETVV
ncbi:hypothetical protein CRUP_033225 [Coryphaenoides rupestris]|nr:hypothetical protein CRUP_033225 [Coryphaenoides rupestris]